MDIAVIGTGYVGLVTSACLAELGYRVFCMDNDPAKVKTLNNGSIPIYEPRIEVLVLENMEGNRLFFTGNLSEAMATAIFFKYCFML